MRAALECTRKTLQFAVFDARAIRRKAQANFAKAKIATNISGRRLRRGLAANVTVTHQQIADPSLLYRSLEKHDKLAYQPKSGFDSEQLEWLFPEEMKAYDRWVEMHESYEASRGDKEDENSNADEDNQAPENLQPQEPLGGHLQERAAVFDDRTTEMKENKYLEFSKVRQGSFLPRGISHRKTKAEKEWESFSQSTSKRGKKVTGTWDHMTAGMVRFLHWLGFDPPRMPAPDDDTTHALAFLAYDRLGRVVEKAIILRNLARVEGDTKASVHNPSSVDLRKLAAGEQLSLADIERAIEDPDIKPRALYALDDNDKSTKPNVQLYFGPGFENRLELEMEE